MKLHINPRGEIRAIYDESLPLEGLGRITIRRASHVEPNGRGRWGADLNPVGGPQLGPFACRSEALAAEIRWLEAHWVAG